MDIESLLYISEKNSWLVWLVNLCWLSDLVWQKISKDKQRPIWFILYVRSLHLSHPSSDLVRIPRLLVKLSKQVAVLVHIIRQHQTCYCGSKSKVQFNLKQTSRGLLLLYNEQTFNRDIYIYIYVDYICWQLLKYFVRDIFGVIFTFNFFFKYTIQQWVLGVSCVTYQITAEVNQCLGVT